MKAQKLHLRCGLVWERTLLEERVFAPGSKVTVGESPRATFTLETTDYFSSHAVLRPDSGGAVLSLLPGMMGRVQIAGRPVEIEALALDSTGLAERRGNALEYRLGAGDGGVLVFGRVGLLFDFVEKPNPLPPARVAQVLGTDRRVNTLFAGTVGFILLTAVVSRLFAAPSADFTVEQLPDRFVSFVTEDPDSAKEFKKEMDQRREEKIREKKERPEDKPDKSKAAKTKPLAKRESPREVETRKIREKVATKGVVGAISKARKSKGALSKVLEEGGLSVNLNDAVAALDRGEHQARVITSTGPGGMAMPSLVKRRGTAEAVGEGVIESGPKTGREARRASRVSRLSDRAEATVSLSMPVGSAKVSGGTLSKQAIAKVVQANKGAIRYCYESQLTRFPTLRGKVVVDFIIEPSGLVKRVKVPTNSLSNKAAAPKVASCLIRFVKRWKFPKPKGGKVRVIYPFTFGRSR